MKEEKSKKKKSKVILTSLAAWIRDAAANKKLTKLSDEAGNLLRAWCQQIQSK